MKKSKLCMLLLSVVLLCLLSGCSSKPSEKDIVGKWESTKLDTLWMEFYPDMTCTGGKWSITKDGQIQILNPDGKVRLGTLKDGKLTFPEFGDKGIFVKESPKKS
jgi:hypothetical protein